MLFVALGSLLSSGDGPGEVSRILIDHFEGAAEKCDQDPQCVAILFVDECDSLLQSSVVAAVFSFLLDTTLACMGGWQRIILIAATNHSETLPAYLRRPGRIDKEIHIKPPCAFERAIILKSLIRDVECLPALGPDELRDIAEACVGYVAADMVALIRQVFTLALEESGVVVAQDVFQRAMATIRASSLRASRAHAPQETSWNNVGRDPARAKVSLRGARCISSNGVYAFFPTGVFRWHAN
jgi:transitional endoplasmic reticulum ATPase